MKQIRIVALIVFGGLVAAWIAWHIASRRRNLPCPPWLGWMLENPITEGLNGQRILNYLDLSPGHRVLDVGCGPGRLSIPAAQRVGDSGEVVGVDIQDEMLARARKKATSLGLENVHWVLAGAGEGRLETAYYDRALLVTVLGEIPDREAALAEVYQALKPGGRLAIAEVLLDPHYQSKKKVRAITSQVGFQEEMTYGHWLAYVMVLCKSTAT